MKLITKKNSNFNSLLVFIIGLYLTGSVLNTEIITNVFRNEATFFDNKEKTKANEEYFNLCIKEDIKKFDVCANAINPNFTLLYNEINSKLTPIKITNSTLKDKSTIKIDIPKEYNFLTLIFSNKVFTLTNFFNWTKKACSIVQTQIEVTDKIKLKKLDKTVPINNNTVCLLLIDLFQSILEDISEEVPTGKKLILKLSSGNSDPNEELLLINSKNTNPFKNFSIFYISTTIALIVLIIIFYFFESAITKEVIRPLFPNLRTLTQEQKNSVFEELKTNFIIKRAIFEAYYTEVKAIVTNRNYVYSDYCKLIKDLMRIEGSGISTHFKTIFLIKYELKSKIVFDLSYLLLLIINFVLLYPYFELFSFFITQGFIFFMGYIIIVEVLNLVNDVNNYLIITANVIENYNRKFLNENVENICGLV